jgi:membrane protein implicated in regulation of membrane protease activity
LGGLEIIFWVVATVAAVVGEVITTSFFLVFFALGAVVALGLAALGFGLPAQISGFVVASAVSLVLLRPTVMHRLSLGSSERYERRGGIVGRGATVTAAIEPGGSGEYWSARAAYGNGRIGKGARVRVLDTDGMTVLVEPMETDE